MKMKTLWCVLLCLCSCFAFCQDRAQAQPPPVWCSAPTDVPWDPYNPTMWWPPTEVYDSTCHSLFETYLAAYTTALNREKAAALETCWTCQYINNVYTVVWNRQCLDLKWSNIQRDSAVQAAYKAWINCIIYGVAPPTRDYAKPPASFIPIDGWSPTPGPSLPDEINYIPIFSPRQRKLPWEENAFPNYLYPQKKLEYTPFTGTPLPWTSPNPFPETAIPRFDIAEEPLEDVDGWPWPFLRYNTESAEAYRVAVANIIANSALYHGFNADESVIDGEYETYVYTLEILDAQYDTDMRYWNTQYGLPECVADWNADAGIDGADVSAFYIDWGNGVADANHDGSTDGSDVDAFFEYWDNGLCY